MLNRVKKKLVRSMVVTLTSVFTAVAPAGPAAAASAMCSGYGCDSWDPIISGCYTSAVTVASAPIWSKGVQLGTVDLRWSTACKTNWTRVTSYINNTYFYAYVYRYSDGKMMFLDGWYPFDSVKWTPMVYAANICAFGYGSVESRDNEGFPNGLYSGGAVTAKVC